jgi:hypothetical protein
MATINHKTYNEATETFKDFSVYDGKETLIFKVDGADQTVYASNIIGSGIIKTSDNGPLSATAKYLSDGLGNNSALALSTSLVGVGATTLFTKMSIANSLSATSIGTNYNAGILNIQNTNTTNGNLSLIGFQDASASINLAAVGAINTVHSASPNSVVGELGFYTKASGGGYVTERMRITSTGNVGIGTSAPTEKLDVIGGALAAGNGTIRTGITYSSLGLLGTFTNHDLGLITNGTEKARITAAGYVGIGTSSPASLLHLYASNDRASVRLENTAASKVWELVPSNPGVSNSGFTIHNVTDNTKPFHIIDGGNVGIGTSTPTATLDVGGEIKLSSDLYMGNNRFLRFERNSGSTSIQTLGIPTGTDDVRLLTTGDFNLVTGSLSNLLTVKQSGNVGIGTTSPTNPLTVTTATNAVDVLRLNNTEGDSGAVQGVTHLAINHFSAGTNPSTRITAYQDSTSGWEGGMYFSTRSLNTDSAPLERMRITSAGAVGIGTSSPSGKLHVAGGDIFLGASYALKYNSTSYITPENNVSGAEVSTGGVFVVKTGVSPAERLRVDASGNVGIGTGTPKNVLDLGAASQGRGLTFDNFSNVFSSYSAGDLVLSSNFYGSTASDSYLTSTTATFGAAGIRISGTQGGATSGQIQFFANAAAAKTAGTAFTPTEICRVTINGLTFNGDTAEANALDDYEEGTFTATITPATSGTITSGGAFTTWTYTKIGRQVTISGVFVISSVASPVGANVIIGGLPFTIFNNNGAYGAFSAAYFTFATSADSAVAGRHSVNTTQLTLGVDASTVAASDEIYVTATYFV